MPKPVFGLWGHPLTEEGIKKLYVINTPTCHLERFDLGIGVLIKATLKQGSTGAGEIYYCAGNGGDGEWFSESRFKNANPTWSGHGFEFLPAPEFDLDDMELAEILMEEMK